MPAAVCFEEYCLHLTRRLGWTQRNPVRVSGREKEEGERQGGEGGSKGGGRGRRVKGKRREIEEDGRAL